MKLLIVAILSLIIVSNISADKIECIYGLWTQFWKVDEPIYICKFDIRTPNTFIGDQAKFDGIEGEHKPGKTKEDVKGFEIWGGFQLTRFPKDLEKFLEYLEYIRLSNLFIEDLTSDDLKPFPKLKFFAIYGTKVTVLRDDLFAFNPLLEVLELRNNRITRIGTTTFSDLTHLRALELRFNRCSVGKAENREEVLRLVEMIENGAC